MFSQTVEYALRAMMYLAEHPGDAASSEVISVAMRVPKPYLSKVLRDLVEAELVNSTRGKKGGFVLARGAQAITVLDVVNAVDPIKRIKTCPLGRPDHVTLCPLHKQMDSAVEHVECSLRSTTLAQLATVGLNGTSTSLPVVRAKRRAARSSG
jgi:Rrf2 family transcriptional regulator, nitric oxide-sensitive transcriptional repressor